MTFIDEAKIFVQSGNGGSGALSFRREANIPRGGPDGGNGGKGGDVYIECSPHISTLLDYRYKQYFKAERGQKGAGRNRHGKNGEDIILKAPKGTQIFDEESGRLIGDLTEFGQRILLCSGGDGGYGNNHFKSSTNRAPRRSDSGYSGEEKWLNLRLKLLCDAGLVGLPNAGKSTFLKAVTNAQPKIADYPFTTLRPHLGVTKIDGSEFVLADIPGLIEGASEGVGLGMRFLGHIERCRVLLHVLDLSDGLDNENPEGFNSKNIADNYFTIRKELAQYGAGLEDKQEIVALNKTDIIPGEMLDDIRRDLEAHIGKEIFLISAASHSGLDSVLRALWQIITAANEKEYAKTKLITDDFIAHNSSKVVENNSGAIYNPLDFA